MRARSGCKVAGLVAALVLLLGSRSRAEAYERQQHFGLQLGGTVMSTQGGGTPFGGNFGVHYTYGLWDAVNFVAEADVSAFPLGTAPANPAPEPSVVATGGVGLMYVFDILRWVPYAGGIAGVGTMAGGYLGSPLVTPDLQLGAGLDYEITRSWTVGVAYRQHLFLAKMNTYPEFTTIGLRFEYVWGW